MCRSVRDSRPLRITSSSGVKRYVSVKYLISSAPSMKKNGTRSQRSQPSPLANTSTSTAGTRKGRASATSENPRDAGCRRRVASDGIQPLLLHEPLAQRQRRLVREPLDLDLAVRVPRCVDVER